MSEAEAREFLSDVKMSFMMYNPFFYFMLNAMQVVYVDETSEVRNDKGVLIASTPLAVQGMQMLIFKNAFNKDSCVRLHPLSTTKHEIFHIVLEHCNRGLVIMENLIRQYNLVPTPKNLERIHFFVNLAMDAKDNHLLEIDGDKIDWGFTGKDMWSEEAIAEDSVEELVNKIFSASDKPNVGGEGTGVDILRFAGEGEAYKGTVIQEGDADLQNLKGKELSDRLKMTVAESIVKAKLSGVGMGNMLRKLEECFLLPKQQEWWLRLRFLMRSQLIKSRISDWRVINRKMPYQIAGVRSIKKPKCVCCIDVSGSITDLEYNLFVAEMLLASKEAEVTAVFWDSGIEDIRSVKGKKDMERSVKGGGGTVFKPVVEGFKFTGYDIMVCLTDGDWYDTEDAEEALMGVRNVHKILCTTHTNVEGFDETIKIKME
jgi:predicted metal-dependent peptidase